ncbi:MAG: hypothetical protein RJA70_3627, partial [Pseudomonadota bacterium]
MQELVDARSAQADQFVQGEAGRHGVSVVEGGVVQVRVAWGENTLCVSQVDGAGEFWVGESTPQREPDFVVSGEQLGALLLPLITSDATGCHLNLLPNAKGTVRFSKNEIRDLEALSASLPSSPDFPGGTRLSLMIGMHACVQIGALRFEVTSVEPEARPARAFAGDGA